MSMLGIGYSIRNQYGTLSPYKFEDYTDLAEAQAFYVANKEVYEAKGVYITLVNIP